MARVIRPDGSEIEVHLLDNQPKLEQMQKMVGGLIEPVRPIVGGGMMLANEEGLILDLEPNHLASSLSRRIIVGSVIILKDDEIDEWLN